MSTTFPYPDLKNVASAAGEIFARGRAGTLGSDIPLLGNQAVGIATYLEGMLLGQPGDPAPPIVPIGALSGCPCPTDDECEQHCAFIAANGTVPITGLGDKLVLTLLVAALKAAQPHIPEPWGSLVASLLASLGK